MKIRFIVGLVSGLALASALSAQSFSGAYLAAKSANIANDYVEAAQYYRNILEFEPENGFIMQGAMVASIVAGDFANGIAVAQAMADAGFKDEFAQTALLAQAFADGEFDLVAQFVADENVQINPLIKSLIEGWALVAQGDYAAGNARFAQQVENQAINSFTNYHRALAAAYNGDLSLADQLLAVEGAYVNRGSILAHAEILAQLDRRDEAMQLLGVGAGRAVNDREADKMRRDLRDGLPVEFSQVRIPADAVSESFLVLADALKGDNSERLALFYARLAQILKPDNTEALLLIAEVLTSQNQYDLAIDAFGKVASDDPFAVNAAIGRASVLQQNGQTDAAIQALQNLTELRPNDLTVWRALGDMLRRDMRFEPAKQAYSNAIDLLPRPDLAGAWGLYYSRAIVSERLKDWPNADRDFRYALALNPDQPNVLNYLGYSLVERGEKLDEALSMIETAVAARPDSGAIADSLGWVYYRLGRFDDAVSVMENAVELLPVDPVVNDHLGDVLWMVGRIREARFQWRRALSFDPDEVDADRIRLKLELGLDKVLEAEAGDTAN